MDILLFDSEPNDLDFYWIDKNRTFVLQKKDFKIDVNFVYHPLKAILDGSYSLVLKPKLKNAIFGIRVGKEILFKQSGVKIYFKIETKPQNKITSIEKDIFIRDETKLKIGVRKTAIKLWNLYWYNLHYLSYNFPEIPTDEQKKQIKNLTDKMMKDGLSCPKCKAHFIQWNKLNPIKENCTSKELLINWYINLHNDVNKRNNKKIFTREEVNEIYSKFDFNDMVKQYKINIIELFNNNQLSKFPDLLNNDIKKRLLKENNIFKSFWLE